MRRCFMRILYVLGICVALVVLIGCPKQEQVEEQECQPLTDEEIRALLVKVRQMPDEAAGENEVAVLETNYGTMVAKFFPNVAPKTCTSFKKLVKTGYYDCTKFHRIIQGFMIQGGDINSKDLIEGNEGMGGPGYTLPAEFSDLKHDKGILSMARSQDINSAGSQFFICLSREGTKALDGRYTIFGALVEGADALEKIASVQTTVGPSGEKSQPVEPVFIKKAWIEKR